MQPPKSKTAAADALVGIWTVSLSAFVICALYFGRDILIPVALAALLTFLLTPLVMRLERWIGRIAAVLLTVAMIFGLIRSGGWILTRQLVDLATKLPDYQVNIATKLKSFRVPSGGAYTRISKTIKELQNNLPGTTEPRAETAAAAGASSQPSVAPTPAVPVQVVDTARAGPTELLHLLIAPL